jgi:hypothetical protein
VLQAVLVANYCNSHALDHHPQKMAGKTLIFKKNEKHTIKAGPHSTNISKLINHLPFMLKEFL